MFNRLVHACSDVMRIMGSGKYYNWSYQGILHNNCLFGQKPKTPFILTFLIFLTSKSTVLRIQSGHGTVPVMNSDREGNSDIQALKADYCFKGWPPSVEASSCRDSQKPILSGLKYSHISTVECLETGSWLSIHP